MQKQFQFAYQLINQKIVENNFVPTTVLDKNCKAAKNGSSKYNQGYSYRHIEIQVVLLKQTNCYLLTIENKDKNIYHEKPIQKNELFNMMEDVHATLEPIIVSIKKEIDKSFPSNQYDHQSGLSSLQSSGNINASGYASSMAQNDIQSSSTPWNQYTTANLGNGQNQTNYDPNSIAPQPQATTASMNYPLPRSRKRQATASSMDYPPQLYYPPQQSTTEAPAVNQSQAQILFDQTIVPNLFNTSSNDDFENNY